MKCCSIAKISYLHFSIGLVYREMLQTQEQRVSSIFWIFCQGLFILFLHFAFDFYAKCLKFSSVHSFIKLFQVYVLLVLLVNQTINFFIEYSNELVSYLFLSLKSLNMSL